MKDDFEYKPSSSAINNDLMSDEIAAQEAQLDHMTEMQDRRMGNNDDFQSY